MVSACLIVLVVRSRRPFFASHPSRRLLAAPLGAVVFAVVLPLTPLARPLGLAPLPPVFLLHLAVIVALYIAAAEVTKRIFYRIVDPPASAA